MLRAVWLVLLNEFRLVVRDRVGMFMLVLAPVVIILVAGLSLGNIYGAGLGPEAYVVPIIDEDHGAAAHAIISALKDEPSITLLKLDNLASARAAVTRQDHTALAIVIGAGTTHALETGGQAQLILYADPVKRLEVSTIELRLDQLCRQITARAQEQARRQFLQQSTAIQREYEQLTEQIKQAQAAARRYRHQIIEQRKTAEASVNAQVQRAIGELAKQTQAAIGHSIAEANSALAHELAPRRDALIAVRNYLIALQASEVAFDNWLARLKTLAGSHASQIPPPPVLPVPPSQEELAELSKPIALPELMPPRIPVPPHLTLRLPIPPQLPNTELPTKGGPSLSFVTSVFPGYLDWREQPIVAGSVLPNAFDQYVPGFGITFLLIAMLMGVGMGLIDERDWGTLQRLSVSGAPLLGVLTGKLCSRFFVGLGQMVVLFAVGWALFGISLGRTPTMLLIPTAAMSFAAASFSLVIACVARTHDSVMPIGAVAAMAMSAIGGCWWPLDFEPGWMRVFAQLLPTTWTMQAYNDLMIRHSAAASALWPSASAAALGLLYLMIGMLAAAELYE